MPVEVGAHWYGGVTLRSLRRPGKGEGDGEVRVGHGKCNDLTFY